MDRLHVYNSSITGIKYIELYDETNSFDMYFHKCDLSKIIKIFKKLMDDSFEPPYQPSGHSDSYELGKQVLRSIDPTLKTDRLGGNWVQKRRLEVIYNKLVELYDKEQFSDLRHLKACYRKDKKTLKEKLSVVSITTLNNIADKLKRREKCAR